MQVYCKRSGKLKEVKKSANRVYHSMDHSGWFSSGPAKVK